MRRKHVGRFQLCGASCITLWRVTALSALLLSSCVGGRVTRGANEAEEATVGAADANDVLLPVPTSVIPEGPVLAAAALGRAVAIYWGQDGGGSEAGLDVACQDSNYDLIILSFVPSFGRGKTRHADGTPETDFGDHCRTPLDANHPYLYSCASLTAQISACQAAGKKLIISLGGAAGSYGLEDNADGAAVAQQVWDIFLGGGGPLRPFGTNVLDGVDLDIEAGSATGYSALVVKLRNLMNADTSRRYLLTAAPQCPYPDLYLGPGTGTALGDHLDAFDFLMVQFYNNYCNATTAGDFAKTYVAWTTLASTVNTRILIGLPAAPKAASIASYLDPNQLGAIVAQGRAQKAFGGIMLWDYGNDASQTPKYSAQVKAVLIAP